MANENGWGDGSVNNAIGWGQGANNAISWGKSHLDSWSGATDIDGGNAPINTVAPALSGTAQEGQTLTCSTGTWSGSPTYTYQWKRNGNNIDGATNSTYTLVTADVGQSIKCTVTATNFSGSANADSNTVVPVSAANLLLDTYTNAAVAYSLRKLRSAYSGSAIRVRRSVDNAEQDIAFVGNDLDTTTMLDFVGYNLWTYSEDISQAVYSVTGSTKSSDVETAPDGNLTGDKVVENTAFSEHGLNRASGTIINATSYTTSAYFKQAERTKIKIYSNISGANQTCDLDLTNGNISNNGFANTPVVTAEANGWYRFSVAITSGTTSATNGMTFRLLNASNAITYTGDGTSGVYVWGYQLSQTSTVKTYQKTVATAGGNGFVATWYDQSTNANNSTQATAANQAQVVLNGNLVLDVDTNKITTIWTNDRYTLTNGISTNTKYLSVSMFRSTSLINAMVHLGNSSTALTPLYWTSSATGNSVRSQMNTSLIFDNITILGRCIMTSLKDSNDLKVGYRNGVQFTNTATEVPAAGTLNTFGQISNSAFTTGQYQEYIYYNSEQSANRTGIETNVNTYWNAY